MKTYELITIQDLLKVPTEKRAQCLRDIENALNMHERTVGANAINIIMIRWKEDGGKSVTVTHREDGELLQFTNNLSSANFYKKAGN